jgi:multiple sugar transport system ATP-binding protein
VLRVIAGLDEVSSGDITIGDRRVNDVAPAERDVGMVFPDYAIYPHLSVRENISFGLKARKFPESEIDKRVRDASAIVEISDLLNSMPAGLSHEQRLRVALARAMVRQPKVFLFDDPLAKLDAPTRARMRIELARLHQRLESTVLYATRDPAEAMSLSDRVVVMNGGSVEQSDPPARIYAAPASMFVGGFATMPPMNFVHGQLKQERDGLVFHEAGDGTIELQLGATEYAPMAEWTGKPIVLGIRPEDIAITEANPAPKNAPGTFPALLEVVEAAGAESYLHLQTAAHTLICRTSNPIDRREAGRRVRCSIDSAQIHFFNPTSGRRIAAP